MLTKFKCIFLPTSHAQEILVLVSDHACGRSIHFLKTFPALTHVLNSIRTSLTLAFTSLML